MKKKIVLGFLGSTKDAGVTDARWNKWRPTISLFGAPDFAIDQIELIYTRHDHSALADLITSDIATVSPHTAVVPRYLHLDDPWDFPQVYAALHEFAKDYEFRDDCEYFVHLTTGSHVAQICLFLLTEARYFPAKLVDTSLDKGLATKWKGKVNVVDLDLSTYDLLASRFKSEKVDSETLLKSGIVTKNAAFNALISRIEKVALKSTASMLLTGPTGAGKSQLAKRIYELRLRRHLVSGPLVEVNCATLRGDTAMSALFGHKKGAFTGADSTRRGYLLEADKGMLFLDEVATLGLEEQALLLLALEEKRFYPVGSDVAVESDFQIVVGTNLDLAKEVAEGRFRSDLYARVKTWTFRLPGLAERPEDIEPNVDYELQKASTELNSHLSFNAAARQAYMSFAMAAPWLGNFRDLSASLMRLATLAEGGRITEADVACEIDCLNEGWGTVAGQVTRSLTAKVLPGVEVDSFDAVQLEAVFQAISESSSLAEAGRKLFAVSRKEKSSTNDTSRLSKYLARWYLTYDAVKQALK